LVIHRDVATFDHVTSTQTHLAAIGDPLDNPAWAAMTGLQAGFAQRIGRAARFRPDVSPFYALAENPGEEGWADLAALAGPGTTVALAGVDGRRPAGWETVATVAGVQLVDRSLDRVPDPETILLGPADVPEILDLVARTKPGPFAPGTIELGTYLGIRRAGALVAMAGERMRLPGWTEISAVCTDPAYRGHGLASRLIRAVAAEISARGDTPFLHAAASNTNAIALYLSLGFVHRRSMIFDVVRTPLP
jgi:ribosomal protein S18 acetylase RimI-like enzyme